MPMSSKALLVPALASAFVLAGVGTSAAQHRHGHAELSVAVDGPQLVVVLEAPSGDLVGFERAAETDEERESVAAVTDALSQPGALLALPEAAGCVAEETEVEFEIDGDHAEFHVRHLYACAAPEAIGEAEVPLFAAHPGLVEIDATIVTASGADAVELEPGDSLSVPAE